LMAAGTAHTRSVRTSGTARQPKTA
jgi:hypothetical protein